MELSPRHMLRHNNVAIVLGQGLDLLPDRAVHDQVTQHDQRAVRLVMKQDFPRDVDLHAAVAAFLL